MAEENAKKVVVFITSGPEDPERASYPFLMANGTLAMDSEAVVILQGNGVLLAKKDAYGHVFAPKLPPVKELVDKFIEFGGKLLVCGPCCEARGVTEDMLVDKSKMITTGSAVSEILEASAVLNY